MKHWLKLQSIFKMDVLVDNSNTPKSEEMYSLHTDFSIIVFLTLEYCLKEGETAQQHFSHMVVTSHQNNNQEKS